MYNYILENKGITAIVVMVLLFIVTRKVKDEMFLRFTSFLIGLTLIIYSIYKILEHLGLLNITSKL